MTTTVHGEYGWDATGWVLVEVDTEGQVIRDSLGKVLFQGPLKLRLINGEVTKELPPSDVETTSPTGFTYTVTEALDHVDEDDYRVVTFEALDGETVELADLVSETEAALTPGYAQAVNAAVMAAEVARAMAAEAAAIATAASDATAKVLVETTRATTAEAALATADTALAATSAASDAVNADHAAAFGRIQRLFTGSPAGTFLYRSGNDYTFLRGIGSGRYAAWFLPRTAQSLNGVTYTVNCLYGCAIQSPMLLQDDTVGTYAGSGTWTTQPTSTTAGTTPGVTGIVYEPKPITVSTTASSGTITKTGGTALVAGDAGRRVSLPAGAAGATYETTIAAVNVGAQTFTVGTAPSITTSGITCTLFPTYRYNATAAGTATYVTQASATSVGVEIVTAQNGGLAKVTLSGAVAGSVAANALPTAADVVASGRYPNTILVANGGTLAPTDRVLDCYAGQASTFFGIRRAVAEGLTADTYTAVVTGTGYTPTGGTGSRVYIAAWAYGLAATLPTTSGAAMFTTLDLSAGFASAFEYAIECKPSTGSTWTFIGQTAHQLEDQQTFTVYLDESVATPADGSITACNSAQIVRTTKLYHPDSGAALASNPIATATTTYRLDRNGLLVTPDITFAIATDIRTAYAMMPLVSRLGAPVKIDRAALEAHATVQSMTGTDARSGFSRSAFGWAWDSTGKVGACMFVPDFYGFTAGYTTTLDGSQVEDRTGAGATTKFYFPWVGVNRSRTVPVGWRKTYSVRYTVGYFADANASLATA